jgi:hypothetical protein
MRSPFAAALAAVFLCLAGTPAAGQESPTFPFSQYRPTNTLPIWCFSAETVIDVVDQAGQALGFAGVLAGGERFWLFVAPDGPGGPGGDWTLTLSLPERGDLLCPFLRGGGARFFTPPPED